MMNDPGGGVLAAILYQGLITGGFGFVVWNMLLQRYGAVSLHTFMFIMPVVGVLLGVLILKEPITGNILMALILIGTGIFVTQFNKKADYASGPGGK
jgi:drug/metabolite transporter (DMT)-like permease